VSQDAGVLECSAPEYIAYGYDSMPLERMAVKLADRYDAGELFGAEEEIADALVRPVSG
jgi:hypothetical protein